MASSGPNSPGTMASTSGVGTVPWSSPDNAVSSNNSYASCSLITPDDTSRYLKATNLGFAIPDGSTVNGIVVEIERKESSAAGIQDNRVRIVKGNVIGSTDKAAAGEWPTSDAYATYGDATDLWGATWTASDINSSTFGAAISAIAVSVGGTASVDHIRITVHYTEPEGHPSRKRMAGVAFAGSVLPQSAIMRW